MKKLQIALIVLFITTKTIISNEPHVSTNESPETVILSFYQKVFFGLTTLKQTAPTLESDTVSFLKKDSLVAAILSAQKNALLLKKHFFLSTPEPSSKLGIALLDPILRCEIPCKESPGNKMIVSSSIPLKTTDSLYLKLKNCCSELNLP